MGIQRLQSHSKANAARICLPITFSILHVSGIKKVWEDTGVNHDRLLMWAAATVCFSDSFVLVKLQSLPLPNNFRCSFRPNNLFVVDNLANPSVIRFFLK